MKVKRYIYWALCLISTITISQSAYSNVGFNILDFGASGDETTNNREAIQKAIDEAYNAGGGRVIVLPGKYLTGGIQIKDNVIFYVNAGAIIIGNKYLSSYATLDEYNQPGRNIQCKYLISVKNARNVTICGSGTIDGKGLHQWENQLELPHWIKLKPERPIALLEVADFENIIIRDVILTNSPNWTCHIRNVFIDQVICKTDGRLLITADDGSTIDNLSISKMHLDYLFIEDPVAVGKNIKSEQFPLIQPHLIQKEAAVVLKNLKNFQLTDFTINWPGDEVSEDWQIPVRLINGDFDLKFRHDFRSPRQTELSVLYGEGLIGGYMENLLVSSSTINTKKYKLENSSIKIRK